MRPVKQLGRRKTDAVVAGDQETILHFNVR